MKFIRAGKGPEKERISSDVLLPMQKTQHKLWIIKQTVRKGKKKRQKQKRKYRGAERDPKIKQNEETLQWAHKQENLAEPAFGIENSFKPSFLYPTRGGPSQRGTMRSV